MTTLFDLGRQLRAQREAKHMFKTTLATASSVHRNTLSQLESGAANVELNTLIAICDQLGLDICLTPKAISTMNATDATRTSSSMSKMLTRRLAKANQEPE
ncbi:MAG: helix-turn-helix transcriptional regulator [Pseudomonadota bacterium]